MSQKLLAALSKIIQTIAPDRKEDVPSASALLLRDFALLDKATGPCVTEVMRPVGTETAINGGASGNFPEG
jgi:hypothetical protein